MSVKTPYGHLFAISSLVTGLFPEKGAGLLDRSVGLVLGNAFMARLSFQENCRTLAGIREFRRILVIGDLNIGDAVTLQAAIAALRDYFPEAEIEYVINRFARTLVEGNPEISRVWPVFTGAYLPDRNGFRCIEEIAAGKTYDLILNLCPQFRAEKLPGAGKKTIGYSALARRLIRGDRSHDLVNHVVYQTYQYVHDMLATVRTPQRVRPFRGVSVTLQDSAVRRAEDFLAYNEVRRDGPVVFYNPDASSPFTRIPFVQQQALLTGLAGTGVVVLVGAGHTSRDIGKELVESLPRSARRDIFIVPSLMPLDALSALIDLCDVFVTADTGPLHLAAARKASRGASRIFRNRTSVVSVFGATPARMYGYDSRKPGFFAANQDAPSFCHAARSRCRNITCINKMAKTCRQIRCFERLAVEEILTDIQGHLNDARTTTNRSSRTALVV